MDGIFTINNSVVVLGGSVCTNYGLGVTKYFSEHLASSGVNIVSGLETDICRLSLKYALSVGGFASGFTVGRYKKADQLVIALINSKKGSLYTLPKDIKKPKNPYITRDRYMVKSCGCVLVIEALVGSRILQAVEYAISINKPVFVVPNDIFSYTSKGSNFLLKTGAKLVDSYMDVTNFLGI